MNSTAKPSSATYPSLSGRHVFITGGSSGIGADMVLAFARQGARVSFVGRNANSAAKVLAAAEHTETAPHFIAADLSNVDALLAAVDEAVAHFGDIDVLVNNAANDERHAYLGVTPEFFDKTVAINLKAQVFAAQAALPSLQRRGGGSIINVGSISWMLKGAGYAIYATCKSATVGLTRSLAREFGKELIRVNTLSPGWVMTERQIEKWVDAEGERAMDQNQCLPGRIQGSDVADLALFLAADDSRMITAQDFIIDAGWT